MRKATHVIRALPNPVDESAPSPLAGIRVWLTDSPSWSVGYDADAVVAMAQPFTDEQLAVLDPYWCSTEEVDEEFLALTQGECYSIPVVMEQLDEI